jgi:phosphoribosyl 1,2-cyclic phosphodiesterase
MKVRFWGVRGSIPCPGRETVKYGGNTACLELRFEGLERLVIIDAGSGIRELGRRVLQHDVKRGMHRMEVFLTHTHLDHILGFPFFGPLYRPETMLKIYGPITHEDDTLEKVLGGQLTYRYFPVRLQELAASMEFIGLRESRLDLGNGIKVTAKYLNHPLLCLGYRFEYNDRVFCAVYDTEPFRNLFCTDPDADSYDETVSQAGELAAREENRRMEEFFEGADLLVHDAQYTQEEYESLAVGWGHTSIEHAINAAQRSGVKRLALFHHDPLRADVDLDRFNEKYCRTHAGALEIFFAREGMAVDLG